jgi:hypothetical protein
MLRNVLFFCLLLLIGGNLFGQRLNIDSLRTEYDQLYGQDMQLYNGRKYFSELNPVQGHVFWRSSEYFTGDIYLHGKKYPGNQLKYNLITQQFVLAYSVNQEQHHPIILINSLIDSIRTDDILFVKNLYPEIPQPFVQQIYRGKISCYAGIYKDIFEKFKGDIIRQAITADKKNYYLVVSSKVNRFHNTKTFVKSFPSKNRKAIKAQLSSQKLKIKRMSDQELSKLVKLCGELMEKT